MSFDCGPWPFGAAPLQYAPSSPELHPEFATGQPVDFEQTMLPPASFSACWHATTAVLFGFFDALG
jgi:hypothetical protein|tara:strand:+ start:1560 stop:1757 length:198 start_codon:yes stop_codon:yes gene_type:complete